MDKNLPTTQQTKLQPAKPTDVESFIMKAIETNVPVETLERLLTMRETLRKETAKQSFDEAFAKFQADCPVIAKDKDVMNKDGRSVRYSYAPLDSIVSQIKVPLAANGFSYSITSQITPEGWIEATAKLAHIGGHFETSTFKVPIDKDGYMNDQQKVASALTYAKRYAFCNVTGIMTGDEDDDSNQNTPKTGTAQTKTTQQPSEQTSESKGEELPGSKIRVTLTDVKITSGETQILDPKTKTPTGKKKCLTIASISGKVRVPSRTIR